MVIIGVGEVGDLFGETFFTKFGEKNKGFTSFNDEECATFCEKRRAKYSDFFFEIFLPNMFKMPVIHLKLSPNLVKNLGNHQIW